MKIIEYASYEEGFILQLFGFFRIGMGGEFNALDEQGPYTTLILGLWKFNLSISLEWRANVKIDEGIW
jgi:hypothetical protein